MDDYSKDVINGLPDNLLCQILSNLSTKEAGSTSLLSKRWRYLFALVPDLDFKEFCSLRNQDSTIFIAFVDRVLELGKDHHVKKFFLTCGTEDIYGGNISSWISKVLERGVSDLALQVYPLIYCRLPSEIFVSKTLVRLKIGPDYGPSRKLKKVCLPKLKALNLDSFMFEEDAMGFAKLLSGCPVLEELGLPRVRWADWDSCSMSSKTLKRLILCSLCYEKNPKSVSFDTPNVVYLEYSDHIAHKYPIVSFNSLVEAHMDIRITKNQKANLRNASDGDEETKMVGKATVLLMGICNVKTLYISNKTLETLNFCCEAIPVFTNLTHLNIDSYNPYVGWESLPHLLRNCPNLETLVLQGLHHEATNRCGDVCLCRDSEKNPSSLSQCPVKFLTILNFGIIYDSDDEMDTHVEIIKHFLKKIPNLEQLVIYYNSPINDSLVELLSVFQDLEKVASRKCKIQVISDNISFSTTVPSLPKKFGKLLL